MEGRSYVFCGVQSAYRDVKVSVCRWFVVLWSKILGTRWVVAMLLSMSTRVWKIESMRRVSKLLSLSGTILWWSSCCHLFHIMFVQSVHVERSVKVPYLVPYYNVFKISKTKIEFSMINFWSFRSPTRQEPTQAGFRGWQFQKRKIHENCSKRAHLLGWWYQFYLGICALPGLGVRTLPKIGWCRICTSCLGLDLHVAWP